MRRTPSPRHDQEHDAMHEPASSTAPSHVRGETRTPLLEDTVGALVTRIARVWPQRPALVAPAQGVRLDWRDFDAAVTRLAAGLHALGLRRGERIGIWSLNRAEWVLMQFASARAGLVLVNINPAYRTHELEYALTRVGCRALVLARAFKTSDYVGMLRTLAPELGEHAPGQLQAARLPDLRHVLVLGDGDDVPGAWRFDAIADCDDADAHAAIAALQPALDPDDPINIQFTSGTTGAPKGATLSHRNIVNNGFFVGECMRLTEQDRLCIPVPFYHCFGMVLGNLACVTHGACMVVPGEGFDPLLTLQTVQDERCTALHGVPTMFIAELDHPDFARYDLSTLRTGIMAGAPCPIEVMRRVQRDMHMTEVTIAYGMTETSPVSFQSATDDPVDKRVTTVGRILPHLEVKIVDIDDRVVPLGEKGELCTRGYSVMLGYWNDPERTADAVRDGWMHTGDLATLDEQGYCNIVGRVKDMVIRGGENVYPREVEEYLFRHPKVAAVQVFGVPDARYGEELCAWIIAKPGMACSEDEIRAFCREQIAHYKVPRYIRFVAELPVTVTGKPQKFLMREAMLRELGLQAQATA